MKTFYCLVALMAGLVAPTGAAEKLKVLVVTGGHGFQREAFFKVFQENPGITFTEAKHG